jgi:hypothetical protein
MSDYIALIFTGVIAIATIIYTFYSIQLWKATRVSAEIARQTAFVNMWAQLNNYAQAAKQQGLPEANFLRQFGDILAEFIIRSLVEDLNKRKNENVREFYRQIDEMIAAQDIDPKTIKWFSPLIKKN